MPKDGYVSITVREEYAEALKLAYQQMKNQKKAKDIMKILRNLEK